MAQLTSKRGRAHNADAAREAILNAAEQVFAEHGFDGTRVDTIAEVAGYNKSLIFQYFGDKFKLYASVIRRADDQINKFQTQVITESFNDDTINNIERVKNLLRTLISAYFDYLVEQPNFVRILNWELAEGWQTYAHIATERDREDIASLSMVMQKVSDSGFLRSSLDTTGQLIMALFMGQLYLGLLPLFKLYLPNFETQSAESLSQAREFITEFITHGLIADDVRPNQ